MRASIAAERAGVPSVSIVCEGFEKQARATGRGHGFEGLSLAVLRGHVDARSHADNVADLVTNTMDEIITGLTHRAIEDSSGVAGPIEPTALDVVVSGTIDDIHQRFIEEGWSDGLPIIPPTRDRVERFIGDSGHDPWKTLGTAKSSGRDLTVWSVAVNAVMAGCRPDHLPILLALTEILADPTYGAEHSGNTTGADALIIFSGPSADELGFNSGQGALREGTHSNTAVGRWLRLYLRNVYGFTADEHDKATFGNSTRVVLAEDWDTLTEIGWEPVSTDFGGTLGADAVTMVRMNSGLIIGSVVGSTPEEILPYLADGLVRVSGWDLTHVYGLGQGHYRPLLILSPVLARVFASAGWSKSDVGAALFEQARLPAWKFEKLIGEWSRLTPGNPRMADLAHEGHVPAEFAASDDPDRLVPLVNSPDHFVIAVAGDPNRTNAYVMSNDGPHGHWTSRPVNRAKADDLACLLPTPPDPGF